MNTRQPGDDDDQKGIHPTRRAVATMARIKARFSSVCGRCKKWILCGELIEWTKGQRATHLTEAQCEAALTGFVPSPKDIITSEHFQRLEVVGRLLEQHPYRFASTYADTAPHFYTRRPQWSDPAACFLVAAELRHLGDKRRWRGPWYYYLDVNEYFYWAMEPFQATVEATDLINRAIRATYYYPETPWLTDAAWHGLRANWVGGALGHRPRPPLNLLTSLSSYCTMVP